MDLKDLSPLAACFVRGFIEQLGPTPVPNKDVQIAAVKYVNELGGDISVAYIRKLFKKLEADDLFSYGPKQGKARTLIANDNTEEFADWLQGNIDYGTSVVRQPSLDDMAVRFAMIEHIKDHDGVVIDRDNQVPKVAFRYLMEKFNKGELQMAFMTENFTTFPYFTGSNNASVGDE